MILVTADGAPLDPRHPLRRCRPDVQAAAVPGVVLSGYLSPTENAMATEPGAWLPIVLWGQLLVLVAFALSWLWTAWGKWQTWVIAVPPSASSCFPSPTRRPACCRT